jgi:hypothetical protein
MATNTGGTKREDVRQRLLQHKSTTVEERNDERREREGRDGVREREMGSAVAVGTFKTGAAAGLWTHRTFRKFCPRNYKD